MSTLKRSEWELIEAKIRNAIKVPTKKGEGAAGA